MSIKNKICMIGAHGLGDSLLAFSCGSFIKDKEVDYLFFVRDEIYKGLEYFFGDTHNMKQDSQGEYWGENNRFLQDLDKIQELKKEYDEVYYVVPDLLLRSPFTFDYKKYNVSLQEIFSKRLLRNKKDKTNKFIYCALNSSTPEYQYSHIPELIREVALQNPDYIVYFPVVKHWAGQKLEYGKFQDIPGNVYLDDSQDFISALHHLKQSDYCICVDNGPSHLAYHLGIPRLLLDYRFQNSHLPWIARWRETLDDSIPQDTAPFEIAKLVNLNLQLPQTQLIPRFDCLRTLGMNLAQILILKY